MSTRFVTYQPPHLAAATMVGQSFPFSRWAASMRHLDLDGNRSELVYTYTFAVAPTWMRWLLEPFVQAIFLRATKKRFARLETFLAAHAEEVRAWQKKRLAP